MPLLYAFVSSGRNTCYETADFLDRTAQGPGDPMVWEGVLRFRERQPVLALHHLFSGMSSRFVMLPSLISIGPLCM